MRVKQSYEIDSLAQWRRAREFSSVEKSAGLSKFGLSADPRFDSG